MSSRSVDLPEELCKALESEFISTELPTLRDIVLYVLDRVAARDVAALDVEEERLVEQRLRDLGYL